MQHRVKPLYLKIFLLVVALTAFVLAVHFELDRYGLLPATTIDGRLLEQLVLGGMILLSIMLVIFAVQLWRPAHAAGSGIVSSKAARESTRKQQILLAPADSVMMAGVSLLLASQPGFGIHSVAPADGAALVREIRRYQADAIIVDKEALLSEAGGLYSLLAAFPGLRVVVLNPEQNTLQVYDRAQVAVEAVGDLLAVLQRKETAETAGSQ